MKKILNNAVNASLCTNSYVAPTADVVGVSMEGVLCSSTPEAILQEWENGTINW